MPAFVNPLSLNLKAARPLISVKLDTTPEKSTFCNKGQVYG